MCFVIDFFLPVRFLQFHEVPKGQYYPLGHFRDTCVTCLCHRDFWPVTDVTEVTLRVTLQSTA